MCTKQKPTSAYCMCRVWVVFTVGGRQGRLGGVSLGVKGRWVNCSFRVRVTWGSLRSSVSLWVKFVWRRGVRGVSWVFRWNQLQKQCLCNWHLMMFVVAFSSSASSHAEHCKHGRHIQTRSQLCVLGGIVPMTVTFLMLNLNRVDLYVVAVQFLSI